MKIYQAIAQKLAIDDTDSVKCIIDDHFPNGSGFDVGSLFDFEKSHKNKLIIRIPYHCMDEHGYYDIWVFPELIITPSLMHEYNMRINWKGYRGKYKNSLNDYIYDSFSYILDKEIDYKSINQ